MLSLGPAQAFQAIMLAEVPVHSIIARAAGWGNASHLPMSPKRPLGMRGHLGAAMRGRAMSCIAGAGLGLALAGGKPARSFRSAV